MDQNNHFPFSVMIGVIVAGFAGSFLMGLLYGEAGVIAGAIFSAVGTAAAFLVQAIQNK